MSGTLPSASGVSQSVFAVKYFEDEPPVQRHRSGCSELRFSAGYLLAASIQDFLGLYSGWQIELSHCRALAQIKALCRDTSGRDGVGEAACCVHLCVVGLGCL